MSLLPDQLYTLFLQCAGVSTDTRKIQPGDLFIALKGPNFNANEFAADALDKGARYVLVDEAKYADGVNIYRVDDGLEALQTLARVHRSRLEIPVIGITGSNGKTTTKELIYSVLNTTFETLATSGNLNNHIGVPLTVLSIGPEIEIAVIEMGANHIGEIAGLCEIARPTHGLITNVGHAHIEGFGSFEGVIRGKSELYQYLIDNRGVVFINSEDTILSNMAKRFDNPIFYPASGDFLHLELTGSNPYLKLKTEDGSVISTSLIGKYNFYNAAAALCVGKFFKVPEKSAEQAVAEYVPTNNRSQVISRGSNTIILDAYNANPSSMGAALDNLISMGPGNKTVILGDMMELGEESEKAHREIVEKTLHGIDLVLLCGPLMSRASEVNPKAMHFDNKSSLIAYLKNNPPTQTTVLIKASRSMGLEEMVGYL